MVQVKALVALALAAATLAGAEASSSPARIAMCDFQIHWRGTSYLRYYTRQRVQAGRLVGYVRSPACGQPGISTKPGIVSVRRITGVSPVVAVRLGTEARAVYVRAGYFPQLRSFPLHSQIYGARGPLFSSFLSPFCKASAKLPRVTARGRVVEIDPDGMDIKGRGASGSAGPFYFRAILDVRTRVVTHAGGLPHVRFGQMVGLKAILCGPFDGPSEAYVTKLVLL